ncbi:hypothetical protein PV325_012409 [Microctonus aethiopoides]|nr:hypothetical protein PV325_012409 [Microctonus aethiopoides]
MLSLNVLLKRKHDIDAQPIKPKEGLIFQCGCRRFSACQVFSEHTNGSKHKNLDATVRKINSTKFQMQNVRVLVATDVAARGIDIPHLDNVLNFQYKLIFNHKNEKTI